MPPYLSSIKILVGFRENEFKNIKTTFRQNLFLYFNLFLLTNKISRDPDEWLNLGTINGKRHPLPGEALVEIKLSCNWQRVAILDYDSRKKLWHVKTLVSCNEFFLPRIYVRFLAKDPENFASRFVNAVKNREKAEIMIR